MISAFLVLVWLLPYIFIPFFLCGIYDVFRNKNLNGSLIKQYFLGNGMLTWAASPLNVILDIISLPFINKGVYKLTDLPASHQCEIEILLQL